MDLEKLGQRIADWLLGIKWWERVCWPIEGAADAFDDVSHISADVARDDSIRPMMREPLPNIEQSSFPHVPTRDASSQQGDCASSRWRDPLCRWGWCERGIGGPRRGGLATPLSLLRTPRCGQRR